MRRFRADLIIAICVTICLPIASAQGQQRATSPSGLYQANSKTTASASNTRVASKTPAKKVASRTGSRVFTQPSTRTSTYVPRHLRQEADQSTGTSSPTVQPTPGSATMMAAPRSQGVMSDAYGSGIGMPVDEVIEGDWIEDGAMDCDECGVCDVDGCGDRPPCWLDGFGGILFNGEYFVGAQAHTGLGTRDRQGLDECGFGFYGGGNFGAPLDWLTCGLFSGQIGISSVNSNLGGHPRGAVNNQLFVTGGFFRRVDYGLQGGVVADFMDASWHFDPRVVQIRSELSWAYPNGYSFGFRNTEGVQDFVDPESRIFNRATLDTYRFFSRHSLCGGGYAEINGGWTQEGQGMMGGDFDVPMTDRLALKSGFTYVFTDAGRDEDAFNIFVGVSLRPRGRGWYEYYHRPLFDVANNGSLIME